MKLKLLIAALSASLILPTQAATAADPVAAPAAAPEAKAAEPSKALATVNGVALPQVFANFVRQGRMNRGGAPEALTDEAVRDAVVTAELLAQEDGFYAEIARLQELERAVEKGA